MHDRDLGFVRFGWRDYDVNTARWTAPDPIGDKGGDPDWYGYCLDDPVNGVDPLGLMGIISDAIDPLFPDAWQWQSSDNACEKCQALNGTLYWNESDIPDEPHPNCGCQVVECEYHSEYSEWKETGRSEPTYHVAGGFCDGAVCTAAWHKTTQVTESRTRTSFRVCGTSLPDKVAEMSEERTTDEVEVREAPAMAVYTGGNPSRGDMWVSTNPWNPNDTRTGSFPPTP